MKELYIRSIKPIKGTKPAGKLCYELLKSIFLTAKIIRSSYDNAEFTWVYKNYKEFLLVETYNIILAIDNFFFLKHLHKNLKLSLAITSNKNQN